MDGRAVADPLAGRRGEMLGEFVQGIRIVRAMVGEVEPRLLVVAYGVTGFSQTTARRFKLAAFYTGTSDGFLIRHIGRRIEAKAEIVT